jgi:DNA polymerase III sliding clamp (beta) subunit (PCNA family)
MQIVISRQELLSVLKRSGAAINKSDMVSVRQCLLIEAGVAQGFAFFTTTDGQLDIVIDAKAEVKTAGKAALNHAQLSARVNELPEGYVEITVDAKFKVTIKSSASKRKFLMTALDPSDFPPVTSTGKPTPLYSVEAKILLQAASEVAFAMDSKGDEMPAGALIAPGDNAWFKMVTVNGHAMARALGWFTERGSAEECLLPRNLLEALRGVPKDHVITLARDQHKIFASAPGIRIRATPLARPFPQVWKQLSEGVPVKRRFRVSSETLLESVRAVSAGSDFVEGKDAFVQIDLTCTDGVVMITTRKSERSQGEDELTVVDSEPGSFKLHVNADYLSQAVKSFTPTEIDLYYDIVYDCPSLFLKNETLLAMVLLISEIASPPPKGSK